MTREDIERAVATHPHLQALSPASREKFIGIKLKRSTPDGPALSRLRAARATQARLRGMSARAEPTEAGLDRLAARRLDQITLRRRTLEADAVARRIRARRWIDAMNAV